MAETVPKTEDVEQHKEEEESSKKKRGAEKEMRREEVDENDDDEEDGSTDNKGTWTRADDKTLLQRKKVKVRRSGNVPTEETKPENFPLFNFGTTTPDKPAETTGNASGGFTFNFNNAATTATTSPFNFNFTTGSTSSTTTPSSSTFNFATSFSFGTSTTTSSSSTSTAGIFGLNIAPPTATSFAPLFGSNKSNKEEDNGDADNTNDDNTVTSPIKKSENPLPNQPVNTGEEDEEHVFQTRAKLYVLETKENKWIERGLGQLRLNVSKDKTNARLIMRVEASLRLILNVPVFHSMKIEKLGEKAVRFTGPSVDKPDQLSIYSVRVATPELADQLIKAVEDYKPKEPTTPTKSSTTTTTTTTTEENDDKKSEEKSDKKPEETETKTTTTEEGKSE